MHKSASSSTIYANFNPLLSLEGSQTNLNILLGRERTQHSLTVYQHSKYHPQETDWRINSLAGRFTSFHPSVKTRGSLHYHYHYSVTMQIPLLGQRTKE
ncbi:MAG: hypothetical protein RIB93_13035 [Coleofasciculus sp. D1-CHI-01]